MKGGYLTVLPNGHVTGVIKQQFCLSLYTDNVYVRNKNKTLFSCLSGSAKKNEAHATFLADVKKNLGAERSSQLFQAIHSYKKTENYENLVTKVVSLFSENDDDLHLLVSKFFEITEWMFPVGSSQASFHLSFFNL